MERSSDQLPELELSRAHVRATKERRLYVVLQLEQFLCK